MTSPLPPGLLAVLERARHVVVSTGAGVSAESGVPTFRDALTGLWARYDPTELGTPEAFARDPKLVWDWFAWRRELVAAAEPNAGHRALVALQDRFASFTLVTQNVDGLHRRAGSRDVIELHGNLFRVRCHVCGRPGELPRPGDETPGPPPCPTGDGLLRPDVVWFGEPLPADAIDAAAKASKACDAFLSVGTSSVVYPAALLPQFALRSGAVVVEINPEPTPLTPKATFSLRGRAGEVLPALVEALAAADGGS